MLNFRKTATIIGLTLALTAVVPTFAAVLSVTKTSNGSWTAKGPDSYGTWKYSLANMLVGGQYYGNKTAKSSYYHPTYYHRATVACKAPGYSPIVVTAFANAKSYANATNTQGTYGDSFIYSAAF